MAKRWLQLSVLFVGVVMVCLFARPTFAAAEPNENQTERLDTLQELVGRLRTVRQTYYTKKAQDDNAIQQARENARLLQTQLDEVRQQEAELDEQIRTYNAELETLATQTAEKARVRQAIANKTAAFIVQQKDEIARGIPYRQAERLARLQAVSTDANETSASPAGQLGHIWSYAQEELRLAGSSETYSDRASVEGNLTPYARYFRLGQSMLGYVTEDGQQTALWMPTLDADPWQSILDPAQAVQVRSAVEILDRRQAPAFVLLPIAVTAPPAERKTP